MAKLGDVCNKAASNIAQKDLIGREGPYPIYGASGFITNVDFYQQENPYIAVVKDGAGVGRVIKLPAKSSVIGTMQYIIPHENIDVSYLAYAMENMNLGRYYTGATIPHIYFKDYQKEELPIPSLDEQRRIAAVLDKVTDLIAQRRAQLDKLDLLVKSRFVEMFGDPEVNSFKLPSIPMTNLCEIIDGDRGPNYPKQEEFSSDGYCLFLNAKNVTNSGFCFNQCLYISKEKDSLMRKGKLQRGDIVLTTRGTIGNLAFYDNTIPYENVRINSGMVILRVHKEQITEIFFIEQFKMLLDLIKSKMASGSAQPQLPISTMKQIMMLVPPIEKQMEFNKIVAQTNTFKSSITSSLDLLETLKKTLMQQYFESR